MKIIVGASGTQQAGWLSTEQHELDITKHEDFERVTKGELVDAFLLEHIVEHIPPEQIQQTMCSLYAFLKPGGYARIAVPDGFHPDPEYIAYVSPPSMGHRWLYDYVSMMYLLHDAGFNRMDFQEYWIKETGGGSFNPPIYEFHMRYLWPNDIEHGLITRAFATDERNADRQPHYTSLIVDAWKL